MLFKENFPTFLLFSNCLSCHVGINVKDLIFIFFLKEKTNFYFLILNYFMNIKLKSM